ncbi:TrkH family potassium uptake protein [Cohnella nanjingensis]|uniref:Trk family potassium uptake protein n=1 Tax=Cohnella nanjingensis TaxID=1387779 RepID=A0A7X0VEF3_9BACL|nr:TrkH family potassium uptake protein [Cohnella nanjingensis]MBB6670960.1 Trk family potassium uptake protein [Cohnella nanjingensis]
MLKKWLRRFYASPPRVIVAGFAAIIFIGTALLRLPASSASGETTPWLEAFFYSASATCVTGLARLDTGTYFSAFGHWVILALVQLGGLGFMTTGTLFALFAGKKVSLKDKLILQESLNQGSLEGIVRLVRRVLLYALSIEAVGALLFALRFMQEMSPGRAIYYGIFHSVSIFNNAGFDLFGQFRSMTAYVGDVYVNLLSVVLVFLGGVGFIVLSDLLELRTRRRLSLHSRVVLWVSAFLIVVGTVTILIFEYTNQDSLGPLGFGEKLLAAMLQSVTTRSAGITTVDIASFRDATQFAMILLMFVGASPGSTGGGIKTTTFAVLASAVWSMMRGRSDVVLFRSRIERSKVNKAVTVTMLSLAIVMGAVMILSVTERQSFLIILFEVMSAYATVGLSAGMTGDLTPFGQVLIAVLMFVGRLGPLTFTYALGTRSGRTLYRYAEGRIIIG